MSKFIITLMESIY